MNLNQTDGRAARAAVGVGQTCLGLTATTGRSRGELGVTRGTEEGGGGPAWEDGERHPRVVNTKAALLPDIPNGSSAGWVGSGEFWIRILALTLISE